MSAVASFIRLPKSSLPGLREVAVPSKGWFGSTKDSYWDYLQRNGREVADYKWSGYLLVTLLVYLQEEQQIDLMQSDHQELAIFLSEKRGSTHVILTDAHRQTYLDRLDSQLFSADQLQKFYNEFNETDESDVGEPMLDGIRVLRQGLEHVDEESVILLCIG